MQGVLKVPIRGLELKAGESMSTLIRFKSPLQTGQHRLQLMIYYSQERESQSLRERSSSRGVLASETADIQSGVSQTSKEKKRKLKIRCASCVAGGCMGCIVWWLHGLHCLVVAWVALPGGCMGCIVHCYSN